MKKILLTLSIAAALFSSCNNSSNPSVSTAEMPKTPEQLKEELKLQEQSEPVKYLIAHASMSENQVKTRDEGLFHSAEYSKDGVNIEGTIQNTASVAKFKDAIVTIQFLSKTGTVIEEKDFPFYEFYNPNTTTPFSIHAYPPEAMEKFSLGIKTATAID
jgi:hypothetical protein